jgi:hypothetical protein
MRRGTGRPPELDISEHGMYGYPEHVVPAPTIQEVPES